MKFTTSTFLTTSALVVAAGAAPAPDTVYQIRLSSKNTAINDALITIKDESAPGTTPNAMGIFSTGEPRNPYTFKFADSSLSKVLYELQGTVRQTHLVLTGNQVALSLFDIAMGADPQPAGDELTASDKWWVWEQDGKMNLMVAERYNGDDSKLLTAGSWRACKGDSEADYTLYWFDGLNRLEDYVKGCEGGISLVIEEAKASPATTNSFLTGVPAPTATSTEYISGVGVPNLTATGSAKPTGSSTPYEGSAATMAAGALAGMVGLVMAFTL